MIALSIISLCVSFLALGFSIFVYMKHDKKLKEYQVYKIEEELRAKKSAMLRVDKLLIPNSCGYSDAYFVVRNEGRAKALNVFLHCEPNILMHRDFKINCLNSGQEERRCAVLVIGGPNEVELTYRWDDELGHHEDNCWICFG